MHRGASSYSSAGEMEGWLKKKSPKTSGKKVVDIWQRRFFVLSGGELKYFKTEKAAHLSNADSLKSIRLEHVLAAAVNPRHADMFIIDLGLERKVKLQAGSERERDAWVAAIEAAKLKAWAARDGESAFGRSVNSSPAASGAARQHLPARSDSPMQEIAMSGRDGSKRESHADVELLSTSNHKHGCCILS